MGLWRGEVVRTTGGFDPALGGCTDWDIWLRSASVGEAVHVPHPLIVHHWHGGNASGGAEPGMAAWHDALRAKQRAGAYRPPGVPLGVGEPAPPLLADCGDGVWVGNRGACNHRGQSFARVVHVHNEPRDPAGVCRAARLGIGPTSLVVRYQDREPLVTATPGLRAIAEFCKAPGPLLVHCSMGGCRGPTMAVLALVSRGVAFDEAKERVRSAVLTYNQGIDLADGPMGEIRAWAEGSSRPDEPLPSLPRMAANLVGAAAGHLASGLKMADDETREARLAICRVCPHFRGDGRCALCGCGLDAKVAWASSRCPDSPPRW
jgi:hypothetical protein